MVDSAESNWAAPVFFSITSFTVQSSAAVAPIPKRAVVTTRVQPVTSTHLPRET